MSEKIHAMKKLSKFNNKQWKRPRRFIFVKMLIAPLLLLITLSGCKSTSVRTVTINDFCLRYETLWLESSDFKNISQIRYNKEYRATMDKFINNLTINAKEYQLCIKKDNETSDSKKAI